MLTNMPPTYFYLPKKDWPLDMPKSANEPWEKFGQGIYCWTLQTYLRLKENGFPCQLVNTLPNEGIVLAHRDSLPYKLKPSKKHLLVCLKADRNPHPYAQFHIVQNPIETHNLSNCAYVPLWPQPGLIKRKSSRRTQVRNVAYMGISYNLAPELKGEVWKEALENLDLSWQIRPRNTWHDYSDVDIVLAVRSFQHKDEYLWKPATKLYNCWHAGVPAILGTESAFRAERQGELDYIEVDSLEKTLDALKELKENPDLYQAIIENGKVRSREKSIDAIVEIWKNTFQKVLFNKYENWCEQSNLQRSVYTLKCFTNIKLNAAKERLTLPSSIEKLLE